MGDSAKQDDLLIIGAEFIEGVADKFETCLKGRYDSDESKDLALEIGPDISGRGRISR